MTSVEHRRRGRRAVARAAREHGGALRHGAVDLLLQALGGELGRERAEHGVVGDRVADLRAGHRGGELLDERLVQVVDDDEALGRVAGLAVVVQTSVDGGLHGGVEVVGGQQDERVGAAELQHDLLEVATGDSATAAAGALRAGHRDALHARVGDDRRPTCSFVA